MLLMDSPRRLSTDIDIIVPPDKDLDSYIEKASHIFPFCSVEEQKRIGNNSIVKRHFKFIYDSPMNNKPFYILLDAVFEEHHYAETLDKEIRNELLITESEYIKVRIPSPACILADKLTAFAPHSTGIPLNIGKDMEVMKQLYDVMSLLDVVTDVDKIWDTYEHIAKSELAYRGLEMSVQDVLYDSFWASYCIAARGKVNHEDYLLYVKGIRELRGHIFAENYTPEIAAARSVKVMYMLMCLIKRCSFKSAQEPYSADIKPISNSSLRKLNYLKIVSPEAYAYLILLDEIM